MDNNKYPQLPVLYDYLHRAGHKVTNIIFSFFRSVAAAPFGEEEISWRWRAAGSGHGNSREVERVPAEEKALPRVSAIPEARDERGARDIRGERVDVGYENPTTGVGEGVRASWRDRGHIGKRLSNHQKTKTG